MFQEFYRHCKQNNFWQPNQKILVAVSGGADSMVLLELLQKAAAKDQLTLAVAHVDHQLRAASKQEADYLKAYCQAHQLTYYSQKWQTTDKQKNTEARARAFRYDFFSKIMAAENYASIMTAHHKDDQAETILLKLTRGSALTNLVGIRNQQTFSSGQLIRPLLIFSKEELLNYAQQIKLVYFEDETNQSDSYARNRLRRQVVPVLKKENPQFLQHISEFSTQVELAEELINSVIEPKYTRWVQFSESGWQFSLTELKHEKISIQTFFLMHLFQQTLVPKGVAINHYHVQQLLAMINQPMPQWTLDIGLGWQALKAYDQIFLKKRQENEKQQTFVLHLNEQLFLSENEWLALEMSEKPLDQPERVKEWQSYSLPITSQMTLPFLVRHRQNGDRIALQPHLTKKVSRLFIDNKIPNMLREQAWLIWSANKELIWIPNFANSYLSIPKETDKIHYRLLYKTKQRSSE
ncbi:tRNA lysidine(34) synthetase TilS [Erwinia sp. CPCC 100877]|nr:tRNA lysidine(34) synthetase TilS [Erwinia sp. CPCC 100877]